MLRCAALAALILTACATTPRPPVAAFAIGMDREAVMALGTPTRTLESAEGEVLVFDAVSPEGDRRLVSVTINEGRVVDVRDREPPSSTRNRDRSGDTGSRL